MWDWRNALCVWIKDVIPSSFRVVIWWLVQCVLKKFELMAIHVRFVANRLNQHAESILRDFKDKTRSSTPIWIANIKVSISDFEFPRKQGLGEWFMSLHGFNTTSKRQNKLQYGMGLPCGSRSGRIRYPARIDSKFTSKMHQQCKLNECHTTKRFGVFYLHIGQLDGLKVCLWRWATKWQGDWP